MITTVDIRLDEPMPRAQQSPAASNGNAQPVALVRYCIPEDQQRYLPRTRRVPERLPAHVPLPRVGDVVYLSPRSAWGVQLVVFDWISPHAVSIEVWLQHVGSAQRPTGFAVTQ